MQQLKPAAIRTFWLAHNIIQTHHFWLSLVEVRWTEPDTQKLCIIFSIRHRYNHDMSWHGWHWRVKRATHAPQDQFGKERAMSTRTEDCTACAVAVANHCIVFRVLRVSIYRLGCGGWSSYYYLFFLVRFWQSLLSFPRIDGRYGSQQ